MAFSTELVLGAQTANPYAAAAETPISSLIEFTRNVWTPLNPHGRLPDGTYGPVTLGATGETSVWITIRSPYTSHGASDFYMRVNGGTEYILSLYSGSSYSVFFAGVLNVPAGPILVEVQARSSSATARRANRFHAVAI